MSRPLAPGHMGFPRRKAPTMTLLSVSPIKGKQLDDAYGLIRSMAPGVTHAQWLRFARSIAAKGGILGVFGAGGSMFGLLTWRKEECLRYGTVLLVENFVTFELSRAAPARRALTDAVNALACEEACSAVRLIVSGRTIVDSASARTQGWTSLGLEPDEVVFTRTTDCCCGDPKHRAEAGALLSA